jgi:glycosyltransferase involved in cell wall biosynthesis
MRILHVTNMWPSPEAPHFGVFVRDQIASLEALDVEVEALFSRSYAELRSSTRGRLREGRWDAVHAHFGYTAAAVGGVCRRARVPLVVSFCGGDLNGEAGSLLRRLKAGAGILASLWGGLFSSRIIVKSGPMQERLPARLRARSAVLANGVDTETFRPLERGRCRREIGWPDGPPIVVFGGRADDPTKNFALAEDAVRLARRSRPEIELRVLSGIPRHDVPIWLNAADAVILTSRREGSPNIVKEAMACDRGIVAVPVGDVPRLLEGVANARLAPPRPEALAGALLELLALGEGVKGGRAAVFERQLDAASVARKLVSIYESLGGVASGGR